MEYYYPEDQEMVLNELAAKLESIDNYKGAKHAIIGCSNIAYYALRAAKEGFDGSAGEEVEWEKECKYRDEVLGSLFPLHIEKIRRYLIESKGQLQDEEWDWVEFAKDYKDPQAMAYVDSYKEKDWYAEEAINTTIAAIEFFPLLWDIYLTLDEKFSNHKQYYKNRNKSNMNKPWHCWENPITEHTTDEAVFTLLDEVREQLRALVTSSKHREIRETALRALYKVKQDEAFVVEHVRDAIIKDSEVGSFPIWIAVSEGLDNLGNHVAVQLNSQKPDVRAASASYIGQFRIKGYDKELANLVDDDTHCHISSLMTYNNYEGFVNEYYDFYDEYNVPGKFRPSYPRFHVLPDHVKEAVTYALGRLESSE